MTITHQNVVILKDYARARDLLKQEDIEAILEEQRSSLRDLDAQVINLSLVKHKLKDAQFLKAKSIEIERNLVGVSDWLEDKINDAKDETDKEAKQLLHKQCEKLITRSERIKKNIADDLAACRFEILTPLTIAGFLGGAPLTAAALERLLSDKPSAIMRAALAGEAIAVSLVFHDRIRKFSGLAIKAIIESPRQLQSVKKRFRNSAAATLLTISVAAKQIKEIVPHHPAQSTNPQVVIMANRQSLSRLGA